MQAFTRLPHKSAWLCLLSNCCQKPFDSSEFWHILRYDLLLSTRYCGFTCRCFSSSGIVQCGFRLILSASVKPLFMPLCGIFCCFSVRLIASASFEMRQYLRQYEAGFEAEKSPGFLRGLLPYEILIFPCKFSNDSFFFASVASAYTFIVVLISECPMIS